jgi:catechol 2,3-dioxygenase-like lactoylglutathione lyase family enzyme
LQVKTFINHDFHQHGTGLAMKLEHVNLTVADLDRSVAFYRHLLDWDVRWEGQSLHGRAAHVGDDDTYLALFEVPDRTRGTGAAYDHVGFNHVGFVVDDLDDARDRLRVAGAEITSEMDYDPGVHVYFLDPDGYEVELVAYADDDDRVPAA